MGRLLWATKGYTTYDNGTWAKHWEDEQGLSHFLLNTFLRVV